MNDALPAAKPVIVRQLRQLGVQPGVVLLTHTSFRAVRPVEGGPLGLVEALLAAVEPGGTLAMPAWTGSDEEAFDAQVTPACRDLGVVADLFWRQPGVRRCNHNFAFAAKGPQAEAILADPLPLPPHIPESPVGRIHQLDGQVLLLGVGHDADTTIHLAELIAQVPYGIRKHCTVIEDGKKRTLYYRENDHCCQRFSLMDDWLRARGLQQEATVGNAHARLIRARDIVAVACEYLSADPLVFLHQPEEGCPDCNQARASCNGNDGSVPSL